MCIIGPTKGTGITGKCVVDMVWAMGWEEETGESQGGRPVGAGAKATDAIVGDKLTAEKYFLISLETAKGASNDAMQAVCIGNMSFLPLYNGQESNVLQALPLLQEAQRYAANHTVICSWLAAREAEVYSYLNDEYHSLKALENATTVRSDMTSRGNPDEDGYWTCYDHLLQVGYQGGCYLRLHRLNDAEMTLEQAANEFSAARIYQQPYILIDLATALSRQGNLEKACTVVEKALLVTSQTHSPSHMKHILSFRDQMVQWNEEPCVKRLDEQLFAMQYR